MNKNAALKVVVASVQKLAQMDPQDEAVSSVVDGLMEQISQVSQQMKDASPGFAKDSMKDDVAFMKDQIKMLQTAAGIPLRNFQRISSIIAGLRRAAEIAEQPRFASLRPRIAEVVSKTAGLFAEVDTAEDLDKPLEQIEAAVHSIYKDQSKNSNFYTGVHKSNS